MEAAERASRWLWIRRSDQWANPAGTQARVWSALAGSPEGGCMTVKDPKRLMISGTSLQMCPSAYSDISLTQKKRSSYWILLFSRQLINSFTLYIYKNPTDCKQSYMQLHPSSFSLKEEHPKISMSQASSTNMMFKINSALAVTLLIK